MNPTCGAGSGDGDGVRGDTEELLLELCRRIIAPRQRRHGSWDDWDGLDPHGHRPEQG